MEMTRLTAHHAGFVGPSGFVRHINNITGEHGLKVPAGVTKAIEESSRWAGLVPKDVSGELNDAVFLAIQRGEDPATVKEVQELAARAPLFSHELKQKVQTRMHGHVHNAHVKAIPEWIEEMQEHFDKHAAVIREIVSAGSLADIWHLESANADKLGEQEAYDLIRCRKAVKAATDLANLWGLMAEQSGNKFKNPSGAIFTDVTPQEFNSFTTEKPFLRTSLDRGGDTTRGSMIVYGDVYLIIKQGLNVRLKTLEEANKWYSQYEALKNAAKAQKDAAMSRPSPFPVII